MKHVWGPWDIARSDTGRIIGKTPTRQCTVSACDQYEPASIPTPCEWVERRTSWWCYRLGTVLGVEVAVLIGMLVSWPS